VIADLRPYPEYKDSGVPWLGRVPTHWDMVRTKNLFHERNVRGYPDEPLLAATQTKGVVRKEEYENRTVLAIKDLQNLKLVLVGDFVISLRSFQGGIEYARHQGIISPAYTVLYPAKKENHGYFAILFKSRFFIEGLKLYVTGIRQGQNIDYVKLSRSLIPFPPPREQKAIETFVLDFDQRCRRLMRNRRRLIEVLNEQKQAIINQAVTRGLDPNVPLKPSGIDWLGDIPEHWEVRRLRHMASVRLSSVDKLIAKGERPVRLCNYVDVYHNNFITENIDFMQGTASDPEIEAFKLRKGDVLITKDSEEWQDIAVSAYVPESLQDVVCGYHLAVIRPREEVINGEYLARAFSAESIAVQFRLAAKGVTRYGLTQEAIKGAFFLVPPLKEQLEIVISIRDQCNQIQAAVLKAQREIDLIREYRTRLIADVVTGKLDVRGWQGEAPRLEEEESELLELGEEEELELDTDEAGEMAAAELRE